MQDFELRGIPNYPQDTYMSQVQTLENLDGTRSVYKASRFELSQDTVAITDFLRQLTKDTHPNLLLPEGFNGEIGERLVEIYGFMGDPLLGNEEFTVRSGVKEGKLDETDFVDIMLQLTSALSYIHKLGYLHRDVRTRNIFVRPNGDKLHVTLFDYNSLCKPFFQSEGMDSWNLERPPELRDGNVMVDPRFDVYALGYILFHLTHNGYKDEAPIQPLDPNHPIFAIMRRAKAPLSECYADASEMHDDLLAIAA